MKLEYKILWFEDQFNLIERTINKLSDFIAKKGLILKIDRKNKILEEDIYALEIKLETYNPYDLIILDYDMGANHPSGTDIARILRASIYTDMVFYSGGGTKSIDEIYKQRLQGVHIVSKENFEDEVHPLIADNIKKISSLNGARGMIMSEWSKIEIDLRKFIVSHINSLPEAQREKQEEEILNRLIKKSTERVKELKKNTPSDICSLLTDSLKCEFDMVRRSLITLTKDSNFQNDAKFHIMQQERNLLAHNEHSVNEDGSLSVKNPKGEETIYNLTEFQNLRKRLINLHSTVEKLSIFSARGEIALSKTIEWLKKFSVPFDDITLRMKGCYTPDEDLKQQWLIEKYPNFKKDIFLVLDDRQKVVDMWRSKGLTCFQVAEGKF